MAEQNMLNRNIDNGDKLRKSALLIGQDVMTAAHVDRHFEDGSINGAKINLGGINVETLGTAETNTTYVLQPDGVGGLVWNAPAGGGGAIDYDGTFTNSLVSTNGSVGGADSIAIGRLSTATNTSPVNPNSYYVALSFGLDNQVSAYYTHGIAIGANITGNNGVIALGANISMPQGGIGIGYNITESAASNIIIRESGTVYGTGNNKVQIGWSMNEVSANPGRSVSIGSNTQIDYKGVAIGFGAQAAYNNEATGVGYQAQAKGLRSVAVGSQAYAQLNSTGSVAVGYDATVSGTGDYGIAIGHKSQVGNNAANAIAIGRGIVNNTTNTVKIGWGSGATQSIHFTSFTPTAETPTATHTIPVTLNGATFRILLTNA